MGRNWQPKYKCKCLLCGWKGKRTKGMIHMKPCPKCNSLKLTLVKNNQLLIKANVINKNGRLYNDDSLKKMNEIGIAGVKWEDADKIIGKAKVKYIDGKGVFCVMNSIKKRFERYINESVNIVGYIDSYGSVHSIEIEPDDERSHPELFPGSYIKRWRWSYSRGFSSVYGGFDSEDSDKIRNHLTKKYGIPWYENGYHDVYYMIDTINS